MSFFLRSLLLCLYTIAVSFSSMALVFVLYSILIPYRYIIIIVMVFNIILSFLITNPIAVFFDKSKNGVDNEFK